MLVAEPCVAVSYEAAVVDVPYKGYAVGFDLQESVEREIRLERTKAVVRDYLVDVLAGTWTQILEIGGCRCRRQLGSIGTLVVNGRES